MINKTNLQKAIDSDINNDQIYNDIMSKIIKRKSQRPYWKWGVAFACVFGVIFLTIFSRGKILKSNPIDEQEYPLYINEIGSEIINEVDEVLKVPITDALPENLKDLALPSTFTEESQQIMAVYIQEMSNFESAEHQPYQLLNYEVNYKSGNKEVSIAFSETNKLLDDYAKEGNVTVIKDTNIKIFHYLNTYLAYFEHNHLYFKIETQNFTQEELVNLISSII